ncbi:hypothetical protein MMC25_002271 [Agyrium rufum]|nr:hypothetical protein [Agyrium rufum]
MADDEEEEEELALPSDTLAALQEFYAERDAGEKKFQDFRARADEASRNGTLTMSMFAEDWNASQFWVGF